MTTSEQVEKIKYEFMEYMHDEGAETSGIPVGCGWNNISDWWLNKLSLTLAEQREEFVGMIEGKLHEVSNKDVENPGNKKLEGIIMGLSDSITTIKSQGV